MSLFSTKIAVDLKPILTGLPKGASIHHVGWDAEASQIVILWEHDRFYSGLTVPVEMTPEDIKRKRLPEGVRDQSKHVEKPLPPVLLNQTIPPKPAPAPRQDFIRTEKQFQAAAAAGKKLEFWGIYSTWNPVTPEHTFTEGYAYREINQKPVDAAPVPA